MKKITVFFSVVLILLCYSSVGLARLSDKDIPREELKKEKKINKFDYSKYLAPWAWETIKNSQGAIGVLVTRLDGGYDWNVVQASVFDTEKGLVVSVGHGNSIYKSTAFGEDSQYFFMKKNKNDNGYTFAPIKLEKTDPFFDLAIYKIDMENGNLPVLQAIKFAEDFEPFVDHYAFSELYKYQQNAGFIFKHSVPFVTQIVEKETFLKPIRIGPIVIYDSRDSFILDKAAKKGLSGAIICNKDGDVVSILQAMEGGYSYGIPAEDIKRFIEQYRTEQETAEKKALEEQKKKQGELLLNPPT